MARPSLKAEKTEHILQAYENCVAQYGVEGATLQKVAAAAGMARPLLRHYVGNQADLLSCCLARYLSRLQTQLMWFETVDSATMLLDGLFDSSSLSDNDNNDILIASAFTLAAAHNPQIKAAMQTWFAQTRTALKTTLKRLYPHVGDTAIDIAATGVTGIYFNFYAMQSLVVESDFLQQSQTAASWLIYQLDD